MIDFINQLVAFKFDLGIKVVFCIYITSFIIYKYMYEKIANKIFKCMMRKSNPDYAILTFGLISIGKFDYQHLWR